MEQTAAKAEVLRYLGYGQQQMDEALDTLIDTCMEECRQAAAPRFLWNRFPVQLEGDGVHLGGTSVVLTGKDIWRHLENSMEVFVLAVTLGVGADALIRRYERGDMTRSVILDACATQLVEEYCDEAEAEIRAEAEVEGLGINFRYSPGYGDLPLEVQPRLLDLLQAGKRIGLTCTDSLILLPRKSVTALVGLLPKEAPAAERPGCAVCPLRETCTFRRDGAFCGAKKASSR